MKLQYNQIITSLAQAMEWSVNAMWQNGHNEPAMKEMAINNIDRAINDIADAHIELIKLRREIINNK